VDAETEHCEQTMPSLHGNCVNDGTEHHTTLLLYHEESSLYGILYGTETLMLAGHSTLPALQILVSVNKYHCMKNQISHFQN
jgi:hypothetical protein